ncbi:MAG: helix-turn-helix domain-containing protein [Caulobacterales bacterium]
MKTAVAKSLSLRAKHSDETQSALVAAASRHFAERGYHNLGIREFAVETGVTRGALYYFFADKEAIFLAVHDAI